MQPSEAELKRLSTSTKMDKEVREAFGFIEAEIHHGNYWSNLPKLRKIRKQLAELQALIDRGEQEIRQGKAPGEGNASF